MRNAPQIYAFDDFQFDADRLALYHRNALVRTGDKKTMQVLAVMLLKPNKITTHEEIIEQVWKDNPHGVTSGHIGQYIKKLRKVFAEFAPGKDYIETVKGRGYLFAGDVFPSEIENSLPPNHAAPEELRVLPDETGPATASAPVSLNRKLMIGSLVLLPVLLLVFLSWKGFSEDHDEKIRQVVRDSQLFESLVLYKNPSAFKEEMLDKYWTAELDTVTNFDRRRIRESIEKLKAEKRRYGDETKCEQFEFQSVEINQEENFAVVKTLEKWFIAVYFDDGTLKENKYVGPYFVSYIVRRVDGRWLIEKSTTARINRPKPQLTDIEIVSEPKAKQEFLVKIHGQDFEPETVLVEVSGEGCPESRPCRVPNGALREKSRLDEKSLENVPLTLASGEFRIVVRNGDSPPSNAMQITVP